MIKLISFLYLGFGLNHIVNSQVNITEKVLTIPTYEVMDPDPSPVFYNGRKYQGAQGRVYPYPLYHNLSDKLVDKKYNALIIENEYIEVCVLPEIGGRIHYAKDKSNDYFFLYHNRVIKPALIGMTGAWVSGGVEWNIPHHHRASSFFPVDYKTTENIDGSKTIWVGETEWRHRTKWIVGITLHPGSSLIEANVNVFNTTPFQNSILIWANSATHANKDYQVIFPPQTQYATFHRKNQFTESPISYQHYQGADFTSGVDITKWVNHIKSTSFFEWGNKGNFIAGIDHGKQTGTIIFGDKHVNPGKKLWSWGNNPNGDMWDKLLSDEDGPYVELMFGSYSDNQPDYSWMQALETKETTYWFAPLKGMKSVSMANTEAVIYFDLINKTILAEVNAVKPLNDSRIVIYNNDQVILDRKTNLIPGKPFNLELKNQSVNKNQLKIKLMNDKGQTLIEYQPVVNEKEPMPKPVSLPKDAKFINDPDSLFFAGLTFEQFHDAHYSPLEFYQKAIALNPDHNPSLLRSGILKLKAGDYEEAAVYLKKIVNNVTRNYSVAEDASSLYYLALAYKELGKTDEAFDLFYRASWDYTFNTPARYQLALINSGKGEYHAALEHLKQAYSTNTKSIDVLSLSVSMLRILGKTDQALKMVDELLNEDPLNFYAYNEKYIISGTDQNRNQLDNLMRNYHENYLELAVCYGNAGLYNDALEVLARFTRLSDHNKNHYPMLHYYIAYYNHLSGNKDLAEKHFIEAGKKQFKYAFPFRLESLKVLETALEYNSNDALAWYLTGNIYYDHQSGKAVDAWEKSVSLSDKLPVAYRNLAFAYSCTRHDPEMAIRYIKKALQLDPNNPRYYYEYDLYQKSLLSSPENRLQGFINNHDVVTSDLFSLFPYTELLTITGQYDKAIELMKLYNYHRWEGGEGICNYWLYAHLFKSISSIENNNLQEAGLFLEAALSYPGNLQSYQTPNELIAFFFKGILAERKGRSKEAKAIFMKVAAYKSDTPESSYYRAKAFEKINKPAESGLIYQALIEGGEQELSKEEELDFFDPFGEVRSKHERQGNAYLKLALGQLGLGNTEKAKDYFRLAKEHNPSLMSIAFNESETMITKKN